MKKFPLKQGEGPYEISYLANGENKSMVEKTCLFKVQAYGNGEKADTFLISEDPKNQGGDIRTVAPRIADQLSTSHGYSGTHGLSFYVHTPENAQQDKPERFFKEDVLYSPNGPYSNHTSKEISRDDMSKIIGQENMPDKTVSTQNNDSSSLANKAFESGIHNNNEPELDM